MAEVVFPPLELGSSPSGYERIAGDSPGDYDVREGAGGQGRPVPTESGHPMRSGHGDSPVDFQRISIRARFILLAGAFAAGLAVFALYAFSTLQAVKVNGPAYSQIVLNKDLLADVLPPPAYLVETRMVALEIDGALRAGDRQRVTSLLARYKVLRSDFEASMDHWRKDLPPGGIREALLNQAAPAAVEMLAIMDRDFVPAS